MHEMYGEKGFADSEIDPIVADKLQAQSSQYAGKLLASYILQPNFEFESKNLKPRFLADIRLRSRDIIVDALHEEWDSLTDDNFPLHRYFGLPEPTPERLEKPSFRWEEPNLLYLTEAEIEACQSWVDTLDGDFSELDDYHLDFAEKPELQNLLMKFIAMDNTYQSGAADRAFRILEHALFNPRFTLEYSGSQVLLAYFPTHLSGVLGKLLGANQLLREIERLLPPTNELYTAEVDALEHITTILKGEVLSGKQWYQFASHCGSVKETGIEMVHYSHQTLLSINELSALVRRGHLDRIADVYNAANVKTTENVLSMAEYLPQGQFQTTDPNTIVDAQGSEHLDLLFAGQNYDKHPRFRPVKFEQHAVVVENSLSLALAWRDYIDSSSVYKITEDTLFKDLSNVNTWLEDPSIGRCIIDLDVTNLTQQLEAVHEIIAIRASKIDDPAYPTFDLIAWSTDTDNLIKAESFLRSSLFLDERVNYHAMVGDISIKGPYEPIDNGAKVHVRIIPKGIRIPDGNLPISN